MFRRPGKLTHLALSVAVLGAGGARAQLHPDCPGWLAQTGNVVSWKEAALSDERAIDNINR